MISFLDVDLLSEHVLLSAVGRRHRFNSVDLIPEIFKLKFDAATLFDYFCHSVQNKSSIILTETFL